MKYIKVRYCADVCEDSYTKGEGIECCNWWSEEHCPIKRGSVPTTIIEALEAICDANGFDFKRENWECDSCDEGDFSRFDSDFMVDVNNSEVTEKYDKALLERWRKGEATLYNCHIIAHLSVCEERDLTEEEAEAFKKGE